MRCIALFALGVVFCAVASAAEKVEILRDEYGVPHVYAQTAAGAAYGSGYAQVSDRTTQLLANLLPQKNAPASAVSTQMGEILEAYCAGVNDWLRSKGRQERVTPAMVQAFSRSAFGGVAESNHIVIPTARSADGPVIAIIDPHSDWNSNSRPYELRVYASNDGLAFAGAAPPGVPFPLMGHNDSVSIAFTGAGEGGAASLDAAWALITSGTLNDVKKALTLGQFPKQRFLIGTADGEVYDSAGKPSSGGILLSGGGVPEAQAMLRKLLTDANDFSFATAQALAFDEDIYKAGTWQRRIAEVAPDMQFAQMLTGWSRRATVDSRPALAFYLFKMELGPDAAALEPPEYVSGNRIRAALGRAQDKFETQFPVDATLGTLFRVSREAAQRSFPVGAGTLAAAGMATPRAIAFQPRGNLMVATGGQSAVQVVELTKQAQGVSAIPWGESDDVSSPHFDDQARDLFGKAVMHPEYFEDRRELERHSKERTELMFAVKD